jgi:polyhydroxyalkanoate synthesis regulator phasin
MTTNPLLQSSDFLAQLTSRTVEAFSLMADANQKVLRELVDLSASTAKEGVRLYAELQSSAVEAAKEGQSYVLRRQDEMQEAPRDPLHFYQKGVLESVESAQRTFKLFEGTAQAVSRSAERMQVTAEHTGKEIQATFTQLAGKVQTLYTPLA